MGNSSFSYLSSGVLPHRNVRMLVCPSVDFPAFSSSIYCTLISFFLFSTFLELRSWRRYSSAILRFVLGCVLNCYTAAAPSELSILSLLSVLLLSLFSCLFICFLCKMFPLLVGPILLIIFSWDCSLARLVVYPPVSCLTGTSAC